MGLLNVTTLQQGLAVWSGSAEGRAAGGVSPGAIDGRWGPNTFESMRAFVANVAPRQGLDAARILAPLRELRTGTSIVELDDTITGNLEQLAQSFTATARQVTRVAADTITVASRATVWPWALGGGLLVFGLGWWLYSRFRR